MILNVKQLSLADAKYVAFEYVFSVSGKELSPRELEMQIPIQVKGFAKTAEGLLSIEMTVTFSFSYGCDRCLALSQQEIACDFHHQILEDKLDGCEESFALTRENHLDLDQLVVGDVVVEIPSKLLCKETCAGVCPSCGINYNVDTCHCNLQEMDPRLASLKQLLNDL